MRLVPPEKNSFTSKQFKLGCAPPGVQIIWQKMSMQKGKKNPGIQIDFPFWETPTEHFFLTRRPDLFSLISHRMLFFVHRIAISYPIVRAFQCLSPVVFSLPQTRQFHAPTECEPRWVFNHDRATLFATIRKHCLF